MAGARQRALEAMATVAGPLGLVPGTVPGAASYTGTVEGWAVRIEDDVERTDVNVWLTVPSPPAPAGPVAVAALRSVLDRLDPTTGAGLVLQHDAALYSRAEKFGQSLGGGGQGVLSIHPAEIHGSLSYRACDAPALGELIGLGRAAGACYWSLGADERAELTVPAAGSSTRVALVLVAVIAVLLIAGLIGFVLLV